MSGTLRFQDMLCSAETLWLASRCCACEIADGSAQFAGVLAVFWDEFVETNELMEDLDHRLRIAFDLDSRKFKVLPRIYALVVPRIRYRVVVDCAPLCIGVRSSVVAIVYVARGHFAAVGCIDCMGSDFFRSQRRVDVANKWAQHRDALDDDGADNLR